MPASDQHEEYKKHRPSWDLVDDCVEGSRAIKVAGVKYLPKPNPDDASQENSDRYAAYKERANFVGFTGHTKVGLVGMVFRNDMQAELPESIAHLKDNANGAGLTLDQMTRDTVGEVIESGRYGYLVDYPDAPPGLTQDQVRALNLQASILPYKAKAIKNWRTRKVGGVSMLSLVVLAEDHDKISDDGFSVETVEFHRVLLLDLDGVYRQQLYDDEDNLIVFGEGDEATSVLTPTKADGSTWNNIPFTFIGSENNDPTVDKAPLLDLAEINISHYRNSADYEESSFMVGQPTPVATGLNQSAIDAAKKSGFVLGSRTAWTLNEGASAMLLQANPNQMPLEGMREKESQMVKIGARIITPSGGSETAEAARLRHAGGVSQLSTLVGNVESATIQACLWAMEFMGGTGDIDITINRDFFERGADPQLLVATIQLLDRGVVAVSDVRGNLRDSGLIDADRADEDIDLENGTANPLG